MMVIGITYSYGFSFQPRLSSVSNRIARIGGVDNSRAVSGMTPMSLQAAAALSVGDYSALATPVEYGPHLLIKGKVLNGWGILYALATFSVAVVVLPFMIISSVVADILGNGKVSRHRQANCASVPPLTVL